MKTFLILTTTLVLSAGVVLAQHGMGRGNGQIPGGPAARGRAPQQPGVAAGKAPKAPKGAEGARVAKANTAVARLERNPELAGRLAPMLPAGMTADQAAAGFKNWGQFVAALNASKNLNIPFADLQSRMTGPESLSLGKAVQELRPDMPEDQVRQGVRSAEREAKQLEREAKRLERETRKTQPPAPPATQPQA